jgi:hypothetical protein
MVEKTSRVVYYMNPQISILLDYQPELATDALCIYAQYYNTCQEAGRKLKRQLKKLADDHKVK